MQLLIGLLIAMLGAQNAAPVEADEMLAQLSKIRLDKKQIYNIRDVTIRRDVLSLAFNRGVIAFLEPVMGKVTGAVFIGSGEIVAIPPDSLEKQQVYKFTGTPVLNEPFQTAILRFTDATAEEIQREISQHAQEDVSPEEAAQFDPIDAALPGSTKVLDLRLLADFLETPAKPIFSADLKSDKRGWFKAVFDTRVPEEVSIVKVHDVSGVAVADIWASFNQRSEARNREAVAHENKSPVEILGYDVDGSASPENKMDAKVAMRVKGRNDGARVLHFALSPSLRVASAALGAGGTGGAGNNDEPMPFYQYPGSDSFTVVLPRPLKAAQEIALKLAYAGTIDPREQTYPVQGPQNIPEFKSTFAAPPPESGPSVTYMDRRVVAASYHDQWLFEGLARYLDAMAAENNANAPLSVVLDAARDELLPVESAGAIWLGPRLTSTLTPQGFRAVYDKGFWVVHMLRGMLKERTTNPAQNPDGKFLALLGEFTETCNGKTASTWDFQHIAEKYAGKKLDWFFEQWLFDTGLPRYALDYKVEQSGSEFTIEGTIKQSGVPDGFAMPVPVFADNDYLGTVQVSDSEGEFRFRVSRKPERVVIDPEKTILTGASQ